MGNHCCSDDKKHQIPSSLADNPTYRTEHGKVNGRSIASPRLTYKDFVEFGKKLDNHPGVVPSIKRHLGDRLIYNLSSDEVDYETGNLEFTRYEIPPNYFYFGQIDIETGKKHGQGICVENTGNLYVGGFSDDQYSGLGTLHTTEEEYLIGGFLKSEFTEGERRDKEGVVRTGSFIAGLLQGQGVVKKPDGFKTRCFFKNGVREGKGEESHSNGSFYKGGFAGDKYEGFGVHYDSVTQSTRTGKWRQGEFIGT